MDDRELLRDYVESCSQDAFRDLVGRHLPMVYSAARRIVRDPQLAEEVAQGVFTTLARKAESIRPSQVVGGWLYNTTRHLAMNAVRSEQRRREREQTALAMQSLHSASDAPQISEYLEPSMAELAEDDRDALVLRYFENRSLREVGAELGISEDAARMRVNRALERLRTGFEGRGVAVTAVLFGAAMTASTTPVPAGLTAAIASAALAALTIPASAGVGAGTGLLGALSQVARTKLVTGLAAMVLVGVATIFVLRSQPRADRGATSDPRQFSPTAQREGPQYELGGSLLMTGFQSGGRVYRHMSGRFAVSALGSRWYLRYTPIESKTDGKADEVVEDYRAASYDGTNIYQYTSWDSASQRLTVLPDHRLILREREKDACGCRFSVDL